MRFSGATGLLILIGITAILVAVLSGIVFFLLSSDLSLSDEKKYTQLQRLHASAGVYRSRLGFYDGVCNDIGVTEPFVCNESEEGYAIAVPIDDGFYCVDNKGASVETYANFGNRTECRE